MVVASVSPHRGIRFGCGGVIEGAGMPSTKLPYRPAFDNCYAV